MRSQVNVSNVRNSSKPTYLDIAFPTEPTEGHTDRMPHIQLISLDASTLTLNTTNRNYPKMANS